MIASVEADVAERDFRAILRRVERGEEVRITRNGIPIARVIPIPKPRERGRAGA